MIGPKHACDVLCGTMSAPRVAPTGDYLVEPNAILLWDRGLSAVSCLVSTATNVLIPIFNDSKSSVKLTKGLEIGVISECCSVGDWGSDELLSSMNYLSGSMSEPSIGALETGDIGDGIPGHLVKLFTNTPLEESAQKFALAELLCKYSNVFVTPEMGVSRKLGYTTDPVHYIDTGDASPFKLPYCFAQLGVC